MVRKKNNKPKQKKRLQILLTSEMEKDYLERVREEGIDNKSIPIRLFIRNFNKSGLKCLNYDE